MYIYFSRRNDLIAGGDKPAQYVLSKRTESDKCSAHQQKRILSGGLKNIAHDERVSASCVRGTRCIDSLFKYSRPGDQEPQVIYDINVNSGSHII